MMLGCAAPGFAENTRGVGVVNGHDGVVFARNLENVRKLGDRAFHRKDAVRPNHPAAGVFPGREL